MERALGCRIASACAPVVWAVTGTCSFRRSRLQFQELFSYSGMDIFPSRRVKDAASHHFWKTSYKVYNKSLQISGFEPKLSSVVSMISAYAKVCFSMCSVVGGGTESTHPLHVAPWLLIDLQRKGLRFAHRLLSRSADVSTVNSLLKIAELSWLAYEREPRRASCSDSACVHIFFCH